MSDVDALRDRLIAERLTARTAEILAAVARVEYYNRQYNASARTVDALTCPPALAMLTPADLAAWVPEATLKVRFEAAKRVADTVAAIYAAGWRLVAGAARHPRSAPRWRPRGQRLGRFLAVRRGGSWFGFGFRMRRRAGSPPDGPPVHL